VTTPPLKIAGPANLGNRLQRIMLACFRSPTDRTTCDHSNKRAKPGTNNEKGMNQ
jgi:hypothetical protein